MALVATPERVVVSSALTTTITGSSDQAVRAVVAAQAMEDALRTAALELVVQFPELDITVETGGPL